MRIDSAGRVGIGTSSPAAVLTTYAAGFNPTDNTVFDGVGLFLESSVANGDGNYGSALAWSRPGSSANFKCAIAPVQDGADIDLQGLAFFTSNGVFASDDPVERLRIDSSGNTLIGGTLPSAPNISLNADGSATFATDTSVSKAGVLLNSNGAIINYRETAAAADGLIYGYSNINGNRTLQYRISANGSAEFAGTVSAQGSVLTSDQRFKENITDANAQLADVTALGNSLRNWDWTADAPVADKDTRFLGLVAQEAETICPGIVTTIARTKDGDELTPEVVVPAVYETRTVPAVLDEEGEVIEPETTEQVLVTEEQVTPATYEQLDDSYKGIKNDILIMKLLGAVAELSAEVAALKAG